MSTRQEIRRIQLRRDTAANWTSANTLLADGEVGVEKDTRQFKIGDGVTRWNQLNYGGLQGPPGQVGFVSSDANNRLTHGSDGGLYVPDLTTDLLAVYNATLNA